MQSATTRSQQTNEDNTLFLKRAVMSTSSSIVIVVTAILCLVARTHAIPSAVIPLDQQRCTDPATIPLNRYPFVSSHDAGTGYLQPHHVKDDIEYAWAKTQSGNITTQLECGSRAFDWRPEYNGTFLGFHHGPIFVPHSNEDALAEVVMWANAHASEGVDALVVIGAWDCEGSADCRNEFFAAAKRQGITVQPSCGENMTLAEAVTLGRLSGGGAVFLTMDCGRQPWVPTYDDTLECAGFNNATEGAAWRAKLNACIADKTLSACIKTMPGIIDVPAHYNCYKTSPAKGRDHAFSQLRKFDFGITSLDPPTRPQAKLYSIMGAWAQNDESTVLGFLHGSSLLKDEERSGLNAQMSLWVDDMVHVPNMIGVNNVCHDGLKLKAALRNRVVVCQD